MCSVGIFDMVICLSESWCSITNYFYNSSQKTFALCTEGSKHIGIKILLGTQNCASLWIGAIGFLNCSALAIWIANYVYIRVWQMVLFQACFNSLQVCKIAKCLWFHDAAVCLSSVFANHRSTIYQGQQIAQKTLSNGDKLKDIPGASKSILLRGQCQLEEGILWLHDDIHNIIGASMFAFRKCYTHTRVFYGSIVSICRRNV